MITESQLEQLAIQWFTDAGWSYLPGPEIAPDGLSRRINPQLPNAAVRDTLLLKLLSGELTTTEHTVESSQCSKVIEAV